MSATISKVLGGKGMLIMEAPDGSAYWFCHVKSITINPTNGGSVTATLIAAPSQSDDAGLIDSFPE